MPQTRGPQQHRCCSIPGCKVPFLQQQRRQPRQLQDLPPEGIADIGRHTLGQTQRTLQSVLGSLLIPALSPALIPPSRELIIIMKLSGPQWMATWLCFGSASMTSLHVTGFGFAALFRSHQGLQAFHKHFSQRLAWHACVCRQRY